MLQFPLSFAHNWIRWNATVRSILYDILSCISLSVTDHKPSGFAVLVPTVSMRRENKANFPPPAVLLFMPRAPLRRQKPLLHQQHHHHMKVAKYSQKRHGRIQMTAVIRLVRRLSFSFPMTTPYFLHVCTGLCLLSNLPRTRDFH